MKEPEKILEAKDICKAYGKNMVLNQVNLTIKAGEIYGLVGFPNFGVLSCPYTKLDFQLNILSYFFHLQDFFYQINLSHLKSALLVL